MRKRNTLVRVTALFALCVLFFSLSSLKSYAAVSVSRITYHGWRGCYRMTNGKVDLVFVPSIARIMRFGYVSHPNVLWTNPSLYGETNPPAKSKGWVNFGGDKLWNSPQSLWGFPPDPWIDSGECKVKIIGGDQLHITGMKSKRFGIRFERTIRMDPREAKIVIVNKMLNTGDKPVNYGVWEIAQVSGDCKAVLHRDRDSKFTQGVYRYNYKLSPKYLRIYPNKIILTRNPKAVQKIGTDSRKGTVTAVSSRGRFQLYAEYYKGSHYPDDGCGQESYTDPTLNYMEIELLGPIMKLSPHHYTTFTTQWHLSK